MNHKRKYLVVFLLATIVINSLQIVANASSFGFMDSFENPMLPEEEELVLPGMYEEVSIEDIPTEESSGHKIGRDWKMGLANSRILSCYL